MTGFESAGSGQPQGAIKQASGSPMKVQPLQTNIRDNCDRGKAGDFLIGHLKSGSALSIVSAYFTIHAYEKLRDQLHAIDNLRFLFGDPQFISSLGRDEKPPREYLLTDQGLRLENQLQQKTLARDCAGWIESKAEIRSITEAGLLHGKMYHMQDGEVTHAMLGSSNFTAAGLGLAEVHNNVELNLEVDGKKDCCDLLTWFNERWEDQNLTKDVKQIVLKELERLYKDQDPQFIYYLTLFHIFREYLKSDDAAQVDLQSIQLPETAIWKALYKFQKDGAKFAINKLRDYNGCILADSVGLGKTWTALAVIKYFELKNERVLVLCPKKLRRNWTFYKGNSEMNPLRNDCFRFDVLSHTDLSRAGGTTGDIDLAALDWGNYDLLVIDESHNFRNNRRATQIPGKPERKSRYERLVEDVIKSGVNTKVLLLSATPVNNEISDLRNQISFIAGGDVSHDQKADSAFENKMEIRSIKETTRQAQQKFTLWAKKPSGQRNSRDLLQQLGGDFYKLLDGLSIARSRKQIQRYHKDEMDIIGSFPHRPPPEPLHPQIDTQNSLSFERLGDRIGDLNLALYNPTGYLKENLDQALVDSYTRRIKNGFTQQGREKILIGMMKVNYLKRLESSIDSFRKTLERTIAKIDELQGKFAAFEQHQKDNPEIDYADVLPADLDDPEFEDIDFAVGDKQKFHLGHIDILTWYSKVEEDRKQLQAILDEVGLIDVERDAKLAELWRRIKQKFTQPTTNKDDEKNYKVLVFTAFADTAHYLYKNLHDRASQQGRHIALVCGDGGNKNPLGKADYDEILTHFSPRSKSRARQPQLNRNEEIDLLIATDCISEGQNLQDCDLLINYDIHWNPVRIIQRFGRIDRIGSKNHAVNLVNFWPVQDLDHYLNVKHRVETRMALVDLTATQTDNLLEDEQLKGLVTDELHFRNQQLKRMRDEVIDLEDFEDGITLQDFSLDEFRADLLAFLESRRAELEQANTGLYAVVPPHLDDSIAQSGVIFCLRHRWQKDHGTVGEAKKQTKGTANINPLDKHYLLYVLDDGTVRLTFAQPKQTLMLMRGLAAKHDKAFQQLCDLFDSRTDGGINLAHYDGLIHKVLLSIRNTYKKRALENVFNNRDGVLPTEKESPSDDAGDYELLTWLVILAPESKP